MSACVYVCMCACMYVRGGGPAGFSFLRVPLKTVLLTKTVCTARRAKQRHVDGRLGAPVCGLAWHVLLRQPPRGIVHRIVAPTSPQLVVWSFVCARLKMCCLARLAPGSLSLFHLSACPRPRFLRASIKVRAAIPWGDVFVLYRQTDFV